MQRMQSMQSMPSYAAYAIVCKTALNNVNKPQLTIVRQRKAECMSSFEATPPIVVTVAVALRPNSHKHMIHLSKT